MDFGKVFISSVLNPAVEDLRAEREAVRKVVDSYEFLKAWLFEKEPASPENLDESYLRQVEECDLFMLIIGSKITDPVTAEYLRAKELEKRILIFAKAVPEQTPQARLLLEGVDVKYATFETPGDLGQRAKEAINEALVLALRSPREKGGFRSTLSRLRKLADQKARVHIRPIIPATSALDLFLIQEVSTENVVAQKASSGHIVYIPTSRVEDILTGAPTDPLVLVIEGRLQWLNPARSGSFSRKSQTQGRFLASLRFQVQDPRATALIERFRAQGYTLGWNREDGISARLGDGWEIVYDEDGRYFRITDPHSDSILIIKHG